MKRILWLLAIAGVAIGESAARAHPIATFNTVLGSFQVELFEDVAPKTVENFLNYVIDGDYNNTFIHRSVPAFVIQGGGFAYPGTPVPVGAFPQSPGHIPTDPPIVNEFHLSNVRGTIAMAKTSDPNSATSEWFINQSDNSTSLDSPTNSGGFTVFGQVLGNGMQVIDAIAQVPHYNAGGAYASLPLRNFTLNVDQAVSDQNFVMIPTITTPPPWQNPDPLKTLDVSGDGSLTPQDVGLVINNLNANGARRLSSLFSLTQGNAWYYDTSGDTKITPQDVGYLINALNAMASGVGGASASNSVSDGATSPVPEPSTMALLFAAAGLLGLARVARCIRSCR